MKEFSVKIKVSTNREDISADEISAIVNRLIDCGLADAQDTVDQGPDQLGEGAVNEAQMAIDLSIGQPETFEGKSNRVLVVVSGGVADPVYDSGLDVEVFDWDNYKADPKATSGVPAHFSDLAEGLDIPVEPAVVARGPKP